MSALTTPLQEISDLALSLFQTGEDKLAKFTAKIALNLTKDSKELLTLSAGEISVGDSIRTRKSVKKGRFTIPKDTKGHVVGFAPDGSYLCLLFPAEYPDGMLSLHKDDELHFLHKPQVADPHVFDTKSKKAKVLDVWKSSAALKKELMTTLQLAGVRTEHLPHHSFMFGHFSALFEAENVYLRVSYRPYPRMLYELATPGSMGDVLSRNRIEVIKALKQFFSPEDLEGEKSSSEESTEEDGGVHK